MSKLVLLGNNGDSGVRTRAQDTQNSGLCVQPMKIKNWELVPLPRENLNKPSEHENFNKGPTKDRVGWETQSKFKLHCVRNAASILYGLRLYIRVSWPSRKPYDERDRLCDLPYCFTAGWALFGKTTLLCWGRIQVFLSPHVTVTSIPTAVRV